MSLKCKKAFITGGAQGLGRSYVDALLAEGGQVVFGDINLEAGETTVKEFNEKYGSDNVKFIQFDVTCATKFQEAFKSAIEFLGYVDLFVNNAGFLIESRWEEMIALNYLGTVRGTFMAVEHMRKDKGGKGGRIVNISSEFGLENTPICPVYSGTKHAVRAFTSGMALGPDVKDLGVEYGTLCPCGTATDLIFKLDKDRCRYFLEEGIEQYKQLRLAPVSAIQEAFMRLVQLVDMNGAVLYAQKNSLEFVKMEKKSLGENLSLLCST